MICSSICTGIRQLGDHEFPVQLQLSWRTHTPNHDHHCLKLLPSSTLRRHEQDNIIAQLEQERALIAQRLDSANELLHARKEQFDKTVSALQEAENRLRREMEEERERHMAHIHELEEEVERLTATEQHLAEGIAGNRGGWVKGRHDGMVEGGAEQLRRVENERDNAIRLLRQQGVKETATNDTGKSCYYLNNNIHVCRYVVLRWLCDPVSTA